MNKKGIGEIFNFTRPSFPKGKKGAIGLSINFIVIVVISLVILGLGIAFLYQLMGGAQETKNLLDARTQSQLERLLVDEGKKVALPVHTAPVLPGNLVTFGIGVLNIDDEDFGTNFKLSVTYSKAADELGDLMDGKESENWLLYDKDGFKLDEYEHKTIAIGVNVPKDAQKGTYIFNAEVTCLGTGKCDPYDSIKKFTVVVK